MQTSRDHRPGIGLVGPGRRAAAAAGIVDAAGNFVAVEERCTGFGAARRSGTPGEGEGCCRNRGAAGCSCPVARREKVRRWRLDDGLT